MSFATATDVNLDRRHSIGRQFCLASPAECSDVAVMLQTGRSIRRLKKTECSLSLTLVAVRACSS
jgi:hypothetical protein